MFTTKVFLKKTKIGNILKNVREHYLRDDIYCGSELCDKCHGVKTLPSKPNNKNKICPHDHYIIVDTNIILDQIDILDEDDLKHVIILQTVYQEVVHRSLPVSKRLKTIVDNSTRHFYVFANEHHKDTFIPRDESISVNDMNDLLIRQACKWYQKHLPDMKIVLITDDTNNRNIATQENIFAVTMRDYIKSNTNLEDKLSRKDYHIEETTKNLFPKHLTAIEIHEKIKSGQIFQGTFRASRENFLEGSVTKGDNDELILIQGREALNRAVDGDIVAVQLLPQEKWSSPSDVILEDVGDDIEDFPKDDQLNQPQPTGCIVGIITRKWRQYCGIIQGGSDDSIGQLFVPADRKIPKIRIETRQTEFLKTQKIIVAIDSWPRHSRYPNGHFVRALGTIGDHATENLVVLLEHDIPHSRFSEEVLSLLPDLPWEIRDKDLEFREDLRHLNICSVDPPGCTDIDDALHCRKLPNGCFEVGVHIADVTHFIRAGTAMDREAASRATTVYLVDTKINMVPELLSNNLCSLRGGEERLAFSCIWQMDEKAQIIKTHFTKSVIKSRRAFTYEEAQLTIDDRTKNDDLSKSLRQLNNLAKQMKKRRMENGALVLASPEIRFQVDDETHDPIDVQAKKIFETNSMVEEFMLQANISVAEKILNDFPECAVLRRHPVPPVSNFEPLVKAGRHLGFIIDTTSGRNLAQSLDDAVKTDNPYFNTMLRILATRCMLQAVYFSSGMLQKTDYAHYGLAVPLYTHFTSPIRRYADVLVHRLLAACIGADVIHPDLLDKRKVHDVCQNLNYRNRMAQYAGRASVALNTHMFFRGKVQEEQGYILYVRKNALQILIPKFGLECTLYLPKKQDNPDVLFEYDEENHTQKSGSIVFHAFDPVTIRLSLNSSNIQHEKITVELVKPFIRGFSCASETTNTENKRKKQQHANEKKKQKN